MNTCPGCGGGIPNNETPGLYPGAISRYDNRTEICSSCGTNEAMANWQGGLIVRPGEIVWPGSEGQ